MKIYIRNIALFITFILYPGYLFSQITTEELPPSFSKPGLIDQKLVISFKAPDMEKIQAEDAINDRMPDPFIRVAVAISISLTSNSDGEWETLPEGDLIWRLTLYINDAQLLLMR